MTHLIYKQEDIDRVREALNNCLNHGKLTESGWDDSIEALAILKDQGKAVMVVRNGVIVNTGQAVLCVEADVIESAIAAITTEGQTP